jgi:bifunctional non-homologous end joining protein LigD
MLPCTLPFDFIEPCLPTTACEPPSGEQWLHEIKHDGYRLIVRKEPGRITLYSRDGNNLTERFPLIVDALANLRSRSCIIDGEAVACGDDGIASFDHLQSQRFDEIVFLYAFDLIEFDGDDRRRDPLTKRKATLEYLLAQAAPGIRFNQQFEEPGGSLLFHQACKLGLEGIVSKRCDSRYVSGRSLHWIKVRNPNSPAARRLETRALYAQADHATVQTTN